MKNCFGVFCFESYIFLLKPKLQKYFFEYEKFQQLRENLFGLGFLILNLEKISSKCGETLLLYFSGEETEFLLTQKKKKRN